MATFECQDEFKNNSLCICVNGVQARASLLLHHKLLLLLLLQVLLLLQEVLQALLLLHLDGRRRQRELLLQMLLLLLPCRRRRHHHRRVRRFRRGLHGLHTVAPRFTATISCRPLTLAPTASLNIHGQLLQVTSPLPRMSDDPIAGRKFWPGFAASPSFAAPGVFHTFIHSRRRRRHGH